MHMIHNDAIKARFWAKVEKRPAPQCWIWTASKKDGGYGQLACNGGGSTLLAHRVSYEIHNGAIPDGLRVLHHCDTPECVNPNHLFLGTPAQNIEDMMNKGRRSGRHIGGHNAAVQHLIDKIDAWLSDRATIGSRLGALACANPRAVKNIRAGKATLATMNAVLNYIDQNPVKHWDE